MKYLKLSEICNPKQWKTLSTEQLLDKGFPVYGANGKIGYYSTYNHELPTIMITCRGATCGSINISEPKSWINGNAMCLDNLSSDVSLKYLAFYLQNYNFNHVISGSAQPQITREGLEKVKVKVYAKELQEKISIQLDKVQKIISESKAILEKYDTLIKSRFIEMFGDPVLNPMGWEVNQLADFIIFLTSGARGWSEYFSKEGDLFLTIKNVKNNKIKIDDVQHIKVPSNKEAERTKVKENDLLISITADLGRTGVVSKAIASYGAYINQHLSLVRLNMDKINPLFVSYFLETEGGKIQFSKKNQSAVKAGLNFDAIKSLHLINPPLSLQNDFAQFVQQIDKSKFEIANSLKRLYNKGMLS